jgi:hypothetical protein
MAKTNPYKREASPIEGAEEAAKARSHAMEPSDKATKKANPQRLDVLRRHMITTFRDKKKQP